MKNYHQAERIELVQSGSNYFEVLENLIDDSEENIQFQTYIFDYDKTGKKIIASLVKASLRGVKVFALADAFGSSGLPSSAVKVMRAAGISFRFFSPLFSAEGISFGRRLHHKIVVVDGKRALLGGINIADKYQGAVAQDPWLDYAVRIEGKLCGQLTGLCKRIYDRKPGFLHREMERRKDTQELSRSPHRCRKIYHPCSQLFSTRQGVS
jgi:cardiolipin synthase